MNPEANKALVFEMGDSLLRSWWTVVAGVCCGLAGALVLLHHTPKVYQASAKILISPQQIPQEFFQTTVTDDTTRRMQALEDVVIRESYMRQLIEETYGLPEDEKEQYALMRSVRNRISLRPTADLKMNWLSFELTFQDTRPAWAMKVVNRLAELYIDQNTDQRAGQARATLRTVEDRLRVAKAAFEEVDRRLNEFSARHSFETEAHLDANLRMMENARRDLEANQNAQARNNDKLRDLRGQLVELTAVTSTAETIARLEQELEALLVNYSEAHPAVARKRRELEELRETARTQPPGGRVPVGSRDPDVTKVERQIAAIALDQSSLETAEVQLQREVRKYQQRIQAVPHVQPQLTALTHEHTSLRERYQDLQEQWNLSRDAVALEESPKSARMELAERAEYPTRPVSPNRQRFFAAGVAAGLALFVGPLLARRLLNPPISSEAALRAVSDLSVLVTIPRIVTPQNRRAVVWRQARNVALSVICFAVLFVVKTIY